MKENDIKIIYFERKCFQKKIMKTLAEEAGVELAVLNHESLRKWIRADYISVMQNLEALKKTTDQPGSIQPEHAKTKKTVHKGTSKVVL